MENTTEVKKAKKVATIEERIEKLENAISRYEKLLKKAKESLATLQKKKREDDIKSLFDALLESGKSVDEIKSMLQ